MNEIYEKVISQPESQKKNTLWYSLGTIFSSGTSMVILLLVTRVLGQENAGVFSLAWSASQLMLTIGCFGMRQFQVSDVKEKYSFFDYFFSRVISSAIMLIGGGVYSIVYEYSLYQFFVTILLCVLMVNDVFAEFYSAFFQHKGKLHIAGKAYVLRYAVYIVIFSVTLISFANLVLSIVAVIVSSMICLFMFDFQIGKKINRDKLWFQAGKIFVLYKECLPLFLGNFVTSFIMNVPKNAINTYMDYNVQACYNILFMPSSVINMINMFICVPFYDKVALLWVENKRKEFSQMIFQMVMIIAIITGVILAGGFLLGIPVLSWIFNIDLNGYRLTFMLLLLGGGISGIISVFTYAITTMRKQKIILYIYFCVALIAQLICGSMVSQFGAVGAAGTYLLAMTCLGIIFFLLTENYIKSIKSVS